MAGQKYDYGIDFDAIDAIDIHAHVEADCHGHQAYDDELIAATKQYFKLRLRPDHRRRRGRPLPAAQHGGRRVHHRRATVSGHAPNSVENLIEGAARNNDVLIPFGTVDP